MVKIKKIKLSTTEILARELRNPRRNENNIVASRFKKYKIREWFYQNKQVITIGKSNMKKNIFYLHGGAYVSEASIFHVRIIKYFLKKGFKVTFLDYPLAPESYYAETNSFVIDVYKKITSIFPEDNFYIFGDSAGGGLALSFMQQARDLNLKKIEKAVLFSPWVDLTMTNEKIKYFTKNDLILPLDEVKNAALLYSRGADLTKSIISPIYGNLDNLCPILLFVGTNEILNPDILKLYDKMKDINDITLEIGEGMQHDWILFPMKESKKSLEKIVDFYNDKVIKSQDKI